MADIIMDKIGNISEKKSNLGNLAVDGLIYGLVSGIAMFVSLAALVLFSGDSPGSSLELFSVEGFASSWQGLFGHLSVSVVYGALFGALVWPVKSYIASKEVFGWLAGLIYAVILLFVAQLAILPSISSPVEAIPVWQWVIAHGVYGLVLGGMFARKLSG
jgi:hypothetical protein